jgi:hypothetical protein
MLFTAEDEDVFSQNSDKDETVSAYRNLQRGNYTVTFTFSYENLDKNKPN